MLSILLLYEGAWWWSTRLTVSSNLPLIIFCSRSPKNRWSSYWKESVEKPNPWWELPNNCNIWWKFTTAPPCSSWTRDLLQEIFISRLCGLHPTWGREWEGDDNLVWYDWGTARVYPVIGNQTIQTILTLWGPLQIFQWERHDTLQIIYSSPYHHENLPDMNWSLIVNTMMSDFLPAATKWSSSAFLISDPWGLLLVFFRMNRFSYIFLGHSCLADDHSHSLLLVSFLSSCCLMVKYSSSERNICLI